MKRFRRESDDTGSCFDRGKGIRTRPALLRCGAASSRNRAHGRFRPSRIRLRHYGRAHELKTSIRASKVLIDTSPFFAGATYLSWVAADALIIPVLVDQHSIEAFAWATAMRKEPKME